MKTFETEKHNIPEGATHYFDETSEEHFAWWNDDKQMLLDPENANEWVAPNAYDDVSSPIEIPQTDIETPEEKEALDSITAKSVHLRDYQKADKPHVKVKYEKWNFECAWHAIKAFEDGEKLYTKRSHKDFILIDNAQDVIRFLYSIYERIEYDESPQQGEERERLEAAYDLFCTDNKGLNVTAPCTFDEFKDEEFQCKFWLAIVEETNYRKESN